MAKIREDAPANMARRGVEEPRAANADASVVEPAAAEKPGYAEALDQQAQKSEGRSEEPDRGRSR